MMCALVRRLLVVSLAAWLAACGGRATNPEAGAPPPTVGCGAVEFPSVQAGSHLIGDRPPPVPYSSTPPTSGWHSSGAITIAVQPPDQPLSEPQQVSVLEAGGVVVTYHRLDAEQRTRLVTLVEDQFPGRVAVTSYDRLAPGEVAMTAWGTLQRCTSLDLDAVRRFAQAHANPDPAAHGPE